MHRAVLYQQLEFEGRVVVEVSPHQRVGAGIGQGEVALAGAAEGEGHEVARGQVGVHVAQVDKVAGRSARALEGDRTVPGRDDVALGRGRIADVNELEHVVSGPADHPVRALSAVQRVAARSAEQSVGTFSCVKRVVPGIAVEAVISRLAPQCVVAALAVQSVVSVRTG